MHSHLLFLYWENWKIVALLFLTQHIFVALSVCVHNMILLHKTWEKIIHQMYKEGS